MTCNTITASMAHKEPNKTTLEAIDDAINDRNMSEPSYSVEELLKALHTDN